MTGPMKAWTALFAATLLVSCGSDDGDDGGYADAGTVDAQTSPFDAPEGEWTFIEVPDSQCMDGSTTGFGINPAVDADKLLIVLEGGGACFNAFSCSDVVHQDGYGASELAAYASDRGQKGWLNRDDPGNPFADWSYVFVPYCSGDVHGGTNPDGAEGRAHVGYDNIGHMLDLVVPQLEGRVDQVVLGGTSAGGFGALLNFDRTQIAFGDVPVHLLDDSGPTLTDDYLNPCLQAQMREAWDLDAAVPDDCDDCLTEDGGSVVNIATFLAEKYTDRRLGLISSTEDETIRLFFGFGYPDCENPTLPMPAGPFTEGVLALADVLEPYDNFKTFILDDSEHVWMYEDPLSSVEVGSTSLEDWVTGLARGGEGWADVAPPL